MSFLNLHQKLLFVHIYKNAGTSVAEVLRKNFLDDLSYSPPRITGIKSIDLRLDYRLIRANQYVAVAMRPGLERLIALEVVTSGHLTVKTFRRIFLLLA